MFIQLNNHKAHIYNKKPLDSSKKTIVFLPGAGMDHRTLSMFKLTKIEQMYNVIAIDLPGQYCLSLFSRRDATRLCKR